MARGSAGRATPRASRAADARWSATEALSADAVIWPSPHARAAALLEPLLGERPRAGCDGLGSSPIVNLHVVYDRVVCDEPFAAGVDTPVQYLFDRTRAPAGRPPAASIWRCRCRAPSGR